jgi:putative cardiolipin synthase
MAGMLRVYAIIKDLLMRQTTGYAIALCFFIGACSARQPATDYPRQATHALTDTANTKLALAYAPEEKRHPGQSGFHILPNGPEALMMRIALIEASQRSVDLQYYSTHDDTTGKLLLEAIIRAADRGVRVRMLLDDWNLDDFEKGAVALDAHKNIDIRVFNPYATREESVFERIGRVSSYLDRFSRRMHNKAIIADNQLAIMGGRNLGDEYFDAGKDINFRDVDVFAAGPITRTISNNFDRYWNSDQSFPLPALNLPDLDHNAVATIQQGMLEHWKSVAQSPAGKQLAAITLPHEVKNGDLSLIWANAELAADSPDKIEQPGDTAISKPETRLQGLLAKATSEFIIFTPYFVPLDDGVDMLTSLVDRGVHVRIVTNSLSSTDAVPAEAGYSHYREALVKAGVDMYEIESTQPHPRIRNMFNPSSQNGLHAKIYMVDRKDLMIGSFNYDPRSRHLNTEQVLVIHSAPLCNQVAHLLDRITAPGSSYHVVLASSLPEAQQTMFNRDSLVWVAQENGKTEYYDFTPHAGFWRRLTQGFFALLPIDNKL